MNSEPTILHPLRVDRDMPSREDHLAVIAGQKFLTLAMCDAGRPYLVSLNYFFDERENCFYIHAAPTGRKIDCLRANPAVWGQVIEDHGYVVGKHTHAYRAVMFEAVAELLNDAVTKRRAMEKMVRFFEPDADVSEQGYIAQGCLDAMILIRLRVTAMSGKRNASG